MNTNDLEKFDKIYELYGYSTKNIDGVRVYEYKHGRYFGADLLQLEDTPNKKLERIELEYKKQNYATSIKKYSDTIALENDLFNSFFQINAFKKTLQKNYKSFIDRQLLNLPEGASYKYINGNYSALLIDFSGAEIEHEQLENLPNSPIDNVIEKIKDNKDIPLLTIIEAAAGYGKTCTAYEIVNLLCEDSQMVPLYIELARNREARIFKHVLQNEIEIQFQGSTSEIVMHQIIEGRIPIVIDGFDELLSKDFLPNEASAFRKAESMLNTILELLKGKSKIIITSRKTAIFNGIEFLEWISRGSDKYKILRISLSEPEIENWLTKEQKQILTTTKFPIEYVSNPVLLAFLRNSTPEKLKEMCSQNSIVDTYFNLLLKREQVRQNLRMAPETQKKIFLKLARLMCEYDTTAADKNTIKELLLDYNKEIFTKYIEDFPEFPKPTYNELADTLSNHVLLDRKKNGYIGFVNEFILGSLIGENLTNGDFEKHYNEEKIIDIVSEEYANLALVAFKVQPDPQKDSLWNEFNKHPFNFSDNFLFFRDIVLKNKLTIKHFSNIQIDDTFFSDVHFTNMNQFENVVFSNCQFERCEFSVAGYNYSGLVNCKLKDCYVKQEQELEHNTMYLINCVSNNEIKKYILGENTDLAKEPSNKDIETLIFECFIKPDGSFNKMKRITIIRNEISDFEDKDIMKAIMKLDSQKYLHVDGDICFLKKEGFTYLQKKYKK